MTQSTDVLHSILVALGDLPNGREVARLVSWDLKAQLAAEIQVKWPKADLLTLSRYILADQHLSDTPLIPSWVIDKFLGHTAVKSESIVFALVELNRSSFFPSEKLNQYFPDSLSQPRAVQHLLPTVHDYHVAIVLACRYWDHLAADDSIHLARDLRQLLMSWTWQDIGKEIDRRFGGSAGILEVLVYSLDYLSMDIIPDACSLISKVIGTESNARGHPCLIYAFGHDRPWIANAAWAALPRYHISEPPPHYSILQLSLPLDQFVPSKGRINISPLVSNDRAATFETCLARTVAMLLTPALYFNNGIRRTSKDDEPPSYKSTLELCVWYLHTHLDHSRSALDADKKQEVVTLMLQNSVLIRVCAVWEDRFYSNTTTERSVINILTVIARLLTPLLASGEAYDRDIGARLFCLFSSSEATDWEDKPVAWDLGLYLRTVDGRLSEQGPTMDISMGRLIRALRALRPLCMARDDLRAAWERIKLKDIDEYPESFWDAEDFELAALVDPGVPAPPLDRASSHGATTPPGVGEDSGATY